MRTPTKDDLALVEQAMHIILSSKPSRSDYAAVEETERLSELRDLERITEALSSMLALYLDRVEKR